MTNSREAREVMGEKTSGVGEAVIGFDSNVLSAFLLANNGIVAERVGDPLAPERIAAFRLFLYCQPHILPSVTAEAGLIRDDTKLDEHLRFIWSTFAEFVPDEEQEQAIGQRAKELNEFHSGSLDCRLIAEAEVGEVPTLISLDSKLISRLTPHTTVALRRPSEFWNELAFPPGTLPKRVPAPGHPLEHAAWWRW